MTIRIEDRLTKVNGRDVRYLENGTGAPVLFLHGSSLGSSADVFHRNVHAFGAHGLRAIAVDFPGFGKSDPAPETGGGALKAFILRFMDALGLDRAALVGHSSSGNPAVSVALDNPDRVSHVVILGTGSLLPPLDTGGVKVGGREGAAQARLEERMVKKEPTLDDTRALLEANLFHHELITDDELQLRHQNSIGRCFAEFVRRHEASAEGGGSKTGVPLWQRLVEVKPPMLLIYGRNDRARAEERATALKERYPQLDLHFAENCKHLVPWDAADFVESLAVPFIKD
jgi:2-hydroxy-6-oxonona-2,4-dienedioate hydrolase